MYFRSISTAPDVHDHFLGSFVADSGAKDAFLFPCDFFDFSHGKVLFHIFPSRRLSLALLSTPRSASPRSFREMSTLLPSDCSEPCSNDLARTERRKYSQGLYACGNLTVIHSRKGRSFNKGDLTSTVYKAKSWPS